jgi:hypothetical protein
MHLYYNFTVGLGMSCAAYVGAYEARSLDLVEAPSEIPRSMFLSSNRAIYVGRDPVWWVV